jgi:hypothetical protein
MTFFYRRGGVSLLGELSLEADACVCQRALKFALLLRGLFRLTLQCRAYALFASEILIQLSYVGLARSQLRLQGEQGLLGGVASRLCCFYRSFRSDHRCLGFAASHRAARVGQPHRKEVERLLLWCVLQRRTALSDLAHEDLLVYQRFLADPQPAERWVMAPGQKPPRSSPR